MSKAAVSNRIREERIAAGITTRRQLAGRIGVETDYVGLFEEGVTFPSKAELDRLLEVLNVPIERIYPDNWREALGIEPASGPPNFSRHFEVLRGQEKLLISRDEVAWTEKRPRSDEPVDVFLSLSCSTRATPHLLLDTIAVCRALGIRFSAAAGQGGCCGSPYVRRGTAEQAASWMRSKADNARALGASVNVNWCTNCQVNLTKADREGTTDADVMRQVQVLSFFEERVRAMGEAVPWKKQVERRVIAEGHWAWTDVHRTAQIAAARLLGLIPGVTSLGLYDGHAVESPCGGRAGRPASLPPWTADLTKDDVRARRARIEARMHELGADTVACQHQACHAVWSSYASDAVAVKHAVSILAEALGCDHPDRYQAAARAGSPRLVVDQTAPNWRSWGLTPEEAMAQAVELVDGRYAEGTGCSCGRDGCADELITVEVLAAARRPVAT